MPIHRGDYSSNTTYEKMDVVKSGGATYWCKQQCTGVTPPNDTYWVKLADKGEDGTNGQDGADGLDAYQPFKGWYDTSSSLSTAFPTPQVGDYAYVVGASSSDPVTIYKCATAGTWADSGRTFNPANNQEFASGESLNTVRIIDRLESSSATDVLSAKQGKVLDQKVDELGQEISDEITGFELYNYSVLASGKFGTSTTYKHTAVAVNVGEKYILIATSPDARYAFATSSSYSSGGNIPLVSGTSVVGMTTANTYHHVVIPSGCTHLVFSAGDYYGTRLFKEGKIKRMSGSLDELSQKMEEVDDSLREKTESWQTLATSADLTGTNFYSLSGSSVYSTSGSSINAAGLMFPCQKGDVFRIYTKGGSGDARAWGVVNSGTTILSKRSGSIDALTNPIILEITDDDAAKLYVNMYGTNRDNFRVEKQVVSYGDILPVVTQQDFEDAVAEIDAKDASQDESIAAIQNDIGDEEYAYEDVADSSDLDTEKWYSLTGSSVSSSTDMSYGYRGFKIPVAKGDIYEVKTYGGSTTGSARSWAIATESGSILSRADATPRDLVTNPALVEITQDTAAYLYGNCYSSHYSRFSVRKVTVTKITKFTRINQRLIAIEEAMPSLENHLAAKAILLIGASFAYSENTWFEQACEQLNLTAINKAVSGSKIHADAVKLMNGTLFDDINSFDIFAMMHVHNYSIANNLAAAYKDYSAADYEEDTDFTSAMTNGTATNAWYSAAFDYIIKKYQTLCYAEKDNQDSPWYGKKSGKPCVIVICTSWHDARQTYNNAAKALAEKWGLHLCNFADNIGFSCQRLNAATGAQPSIIFANETTTETFSIDGVSGTYTVGWHPLRGRSQYIQQKMAKIFADCVREHLW